MKQKRLIILVSILCILLAATGSAIYALDLLPIGNDSHLTKAHIKNAQRIKSLEIPHEQQNTLLQGKVYLGADSKILEVTLGFPRFMTAYISNSGLVEVWGYHFEGDGRPTLFELEKDTLTRAYVSSYADIDARYPGIIIR